MAELSEGWRTASLSGQVTGSQVWVKSIGGAFAVSDREDPDGAVLVFSKDAWQAFITGAKNNEFDN